MKILAQRMRVSIATAILAVTAFAPGHAAEKPQPALLVVAAARLQYQRLRAGRSNSTTL